MKVIIDDSEEAQEAQNGVTVIINTFIGRDRHVRITGEGIIIDMVRDGVVDATVCHGFEELDPKDAYCGMCGSFHEEPLVCQVTNLEQENEVRRLGTLFNELSEFYWSASWLIDLDVRLYVWLIDPSSPLRPEHREELQRLSQKTGKWFWWPEGANGEVPIDREDWKKKHTHAIQTRQRDIQRGQDA